METTVKLVRTVADEDGNLKMNDGTNRTIAQAFRGCRVLAVYPEEHLIKCASFLRFPTAQRLKCFSSSSSRSGPVRSVSALSVTPQSATRQYYRFVIDKRETDFGRLQGSRKVPAEG